MPKLAYFQATSKSEIETNEFVKGFLEAGLPPHQVGTYLSMFELLDVNDNPWEVSNKWQEDFIKETPAWWKDFIESLNWPGSRTAAQFSSRLLTHSTCSVIDALYFMMHSASVLPVPGVTISAQYIRSLLPCDIVECWDDNFSDCKITSAENYKSSQEFFEPLKFERAAIAFLEYPVIARWKSIMDHTVYDRVSCKAPPESNIPHLNAVRDCFGANLKLKHLCAKPTQEKLNLLTFDNAIATPTSRTAAVMYCLQQGQTLTELDQLQLRMLLNNTTQLSELLTIEELKH